MYKFKARTINLLHHIQFKVYSTVTGLVSTSLMYSATEIGPVAFILLVRCLSMESLCCSWELELEEHGLRAATPHLTET